MPSPVHAARTCDNRFLTPPASSFTEWLKNPDWGGESPIPTPIDGSVKVSDKEHPDPETIYFSVVDENTFPADLQKLIKSLRKDSRPLSEDEAEVGAIVARYGDGTSKGIRFTSRRRENGLYALDSLDMDNAINISKIFPSKPIKSVELAVHLHTHPHLANPRFGGKRTIIVPSIDDYEYWISLREQLRSNHTRPKFHAIVIPSGSAVKNIAFSIEDRHLDAFLQERRSVDMRTLQPQ